MRSVAAVSRLTAERGGFGRLEELGYKPVDRNLLPRGPPAVAVAAPVGVVNERPGSALDRPTALARRALG